MKYFNPSYWFKMWVLSAPLFNDKTQGINARLIDSKQNIKNWANENTTGISALTDQTSNFSNSTEFINYQNYLDNQLLPNNLNPVEFETTPHKHRHEKNRNRHKRDKKLTITTLSIALLIRGFWDRDSSQYLSNLDEIRNNLIEERIVQRVNTNSQSTSICIFDPNLPTDNSHLVIMPVVTSDEDEDEGIRITLVLTARCLYLQGFILTETNGTQHFFHFNGNDIISNINDISHDNTYNLGFNGDYISLGGNAELTWDDIHRAFQYIRGLTNFQNYRNNRNNIFIGTTNSEARSSLVNIILAASESLRTVSIRNHLGNMISNRNSINWRTDIQPQASNWNSNSRSSDISDIAILSPNAIGTIEPNISDQPSTSRGTSSSRPAWYSKTKEKKEEVCNIKKKDRNRNRGTRSIDDCLIINSIAILQKDSTISNVVKRGSIWMGTNYGAYFKYQNSDSITKINNLDESVKSIVVDHQGSAYAIAHSGNFYYIAANSWNAQKITIGNGVTKIITTKILKEDSSLTSYVKKGSVWIGTNQGVYFQYQKEYNYPITKINNLDESVKSIVVDHQGSAYAIAHSGNFYYIAANSWNAIKQNLGVDPNNNVPNGVNYALILQKDIEINDNVKFNFNKGDLLCGTTKGIFYKKIDDNDFRFMILPSYGNIDYIYVDYEKPLIYFISDNNVFYIKEKIYTDHTNTDYFRVEYKTFQHDVIKLQIAPKTALNIIHFYSKKSKDEFKSYLMDLIKKFKKDDATGIGGSINNSDYNTAVDFIYDHFSNFQNLETNLKTKIQRMDKNVIVRTNRVSYWYDDSMHIWDIKEGKRLKRENVVINKNKWTDDFTKSVNHQHQHHLISKNNNSNISLLREQNIIDVKEINSIVFNNQTDTNYVTNNNVTVGI